MLSYVVLSYLILPTVEPLYPPDNMDSQSSLSLTFPERRPPSSPSLQSHSVVRHPPFDQDETFPMELLFEPQSEETHLGYPSLHLESGQGYC